MKKVLWLIGAVLVLLLAVVLARTVRFTTPRSAVDPAPAVTVDPGAAERLAAAVRIPTISHDDAAAIDAEAFRALHAHLASSFPRAHAALQRETVNAHSLLYTWRGSDPSLEPLLLAGHLDVVPVDPGSEASWEQDPFGGRIVDGFVWGRGALDDKSTILGTLEAVEMLVAEGFRPKRTIYLAYGHDEEIGGTRGAREISARLKSRGVTLEMVLDEGGVIGEGVLPGVAVPVALVGVAEKGFATVELRTPGAGGHSSMPPPQTAIGILSAAITRLESHQMPARLEGPTARLFESVGGEFPFVQRAVFANLWLTRPLVVRKMEASASSNAMVRTTTAATVFQAGTKDNVLPASARALVNFRILPGNTVAGVVEHVRRVVDDDRIEIRPAGEFSVEPSVISDSDSAAFHTLERSIRSVAPDVLVAPYLVVGGTDARYYAGLSDSVFRFLPVRLAAADLARMHGTNERIPVRQYEDAIRTYRQLILNAAGN